MGDDQEWMKLSTDDQCTHKVWKARLHGYTEAAKLFNKIPDEKSPEYTKYAGLMKKFVTDSNAVAQEKGLDAVLAYQATAAMAPRTCGEVAAGVVTKCLNSSRTKTKEKGIEILMVYIELEKQDVVMEEVLKGLTNKQPKIVTACTLVIRQAVRDFGNKVIALKPVVKSLQKILEHSDKNVRQEAKLLAVEMYRWIGAAIKPSLQNIKPVQLKELEEEFEKLPGKGAKQVRFLKSQQDLKAKAEAQDEEEEEEEEDEADAGPAVDPFDLIEPVEILSKLPKDFYESMEAKKWQIRKEALDTVLPLATKPKLEPGDYADLVRTLKKVIAKDTNVMIVAVAGKCMCGLAVGLRKKFAPYAVQCIGTILEKFKEKKLNVVTALREAIDAIFPSTTLQNIMEDVVAALDNKNPNIRAETAAFLGRVFSKSTPSSLPKSVLKPLCSSLVQKLADTTPLVRDNVSVALGTALKVVGEKPMAPFFADLDKIKLDKIKECCDKAEVVKGAKGGGGGGGGASGGKKAAAAAAPSAKEKPAEKPKRSGPAGKPKAGGAAKKSAKPAGGAKSVKGGKGGKKKAAASGSGAQSEPVLPDEEIEERAKAVLPASILTQLASTNWKERLAGMEEFTKKVLNMEKKDIDAQVMVRVLARKPGWKEANFQVMGAKVQLVGILAEKARFTTTSAKFCIHGMIDKIGDIKSGSKVQEAMTAMAEATTLGYISLEAVKYAFDGQKNPKNQAETLNWLAQSIQEFGFSTLTPKAYISYAKKGLGAVNPQVRAAAISLLGVMYMYMGGNLRMLFEDEKAALLQQIDTEFEKMSGQTPPAPFRGLAKKGADDGGDDDDDEDGDEGDDDQGAGPGMNVVDLVPRTDISGQVTSGLIAELNDTKWKVRGEALEKVEGILKSAKFITPNIGELPAALKPRLTESNKNIAKQAAAICATIATAMGAPVKKYASTLLPGMLTMTSDSKPQVRAAATEALKAWEEQIGLAPFIEDEILSTALGLNKPLIKIEVFGFLAPSLPKYRTLPGDLAMSVPHLFASLEDRNAEVRKKATEALPGFMMHLGYEKTVKMTGKLKPSSKTQVCSILEKERENIPAKPGKPASAKSGGKKGGSSASSPEDQVETKPTKSVKRPKTAPAKSESNSNSSAAVSSAPSVNDTAPSAGNGGKKPSKEKPSGIAKGKVGSKSSRKKKDEEEDTGPALVMNKGKDRRIRDESDLKVLKWNFTQPRQEYVDQLRDQMENCMSKTLMAKLFHNDFKQQLVAIHMLNESLESCKEATIASLDLILKWMTLRFFDTNTSLHIKGLEYLTGLYALLAEEDYNLLDNEAHSFIPYLIIKVGDSKENIRKLTRTVLRLLTKVYPASKMFTFIMEGLKSKNSRQRAECLEELGGLIETYGLNICQPSPPKAVKEIAGQIGDRDNSVRSAALNTLVQIYLLINEDVYKYCGHLSDKDMGMLEERIKRSARKNAAAAKTSAPVNQQKADDKTANKPGKSGLPPGWRDAYRWMKKKMKGDQVKPAGTPIDNADEERNPSKGPRPATAPPAPGKDLNANRPKVFSLDLDKLGLDSTSDNYSDPALEDTNCVDDLLAKPVVMPQIRAQKPSTPNNMQLNILISQIASSDLAVCIQALAQLDEVLKLQDKEKVMSEHVDQLLVTTLIQLRMAFSKHMGDENSSKDVVRMYRCLVALLMSLFQCSELAQKASKEVLCDLINGLITALIDDRLMSFDEGPQVVRSVNVLMVKVVENADPNYALGALIKLLHECVAHESNSPKFIQLVMKCLWRMVRMMPSIINQLKVEHVLLDIHLFLRAFPSSTWKERPSDVPLRTVKTILHSLAKILGNKVLNYFTLISNPKESEVESYLKKVLRSSARSSTGSLDQVNGSASESEKNNNPHQQTPLMRSSPRRAARNQDLTTIFSKIGSKENTREGLAELYDFKLRYPEEDIEPFLKKTSQVFQNYIERGLRNIAAERGDKGGISLSSTTTKSQPISTTASAPIINSMTATDNENLSMTAMRERLKVLRSQFGNDNTESSNNNPNATNNQSATDQQPPKEPLPSSEHNSPQHQLFSSPEISLGSSSSNVQASQQQNAGQDHNVDDLKKRLDRIKSSLKK